MTFNAAQPDKSYFANTHQVGGIRTGTLDYPDTSGRTGSRVAFFNTGGGLRFTVALDRGADVVEAMYNQYSLAYLSPNGYKPPEHAYQRGSEWLASWSAGLITTCGPVSIGNAQGKIPGQEGVHGRFSNTPASIEAVSNADPARNKLDMSLAVVVSEARMFGPHVEIRRVYHCTLGSNVLRIHDTVSNLGNETMPHHYLYHCNFGYPLLGPGTRVIAKGKAFRNWARPGEGFMDPESKWMKQIKTISEPLDTHKGSGEHGMVLQPTADADGMCHVGLYNPSLKLAVEMIYPQKDLPNLANWQHLGPGGSYVTGIEPHYGALVARDDADYTRTKLEPGESREYDFSMQVREGEEAVAFADEYDGEITV